MAASGKEEALAEVLAVSQMAHVHFVRQDEPRGLGHAVGMARELGIRPGSMRVNTHLYGPIGGWIDDSAVDGQTIPLSELEHHGHPVGSRTVEIAPGQTRRLTYTVMSGLDQPADVNLRVTPGVRGDGVGDIEPSACTPD